MKRFLRFTALAALALSLAPIKPRPVVAQNNQPAGQPKASEPAKPADGKSTAENTVVLKGKVIDDLVVDERDKLIAGALVSGLYNLDQTPSRGLEKVVTASDGSFKLNRKPLSVFLHATSSDGRLVGIARAAPDQSEITIHVGATANAVGRLVDRAGKPVMLGYLKHGIRIPENDRTAGFSWFGGGVAILDSDGRFTLTGLVPGERYEITYAPQNEDIYRTLGYVLAPAPGEIEVGKLVFVQSGGRETLLRSDKEDLQDELQRQDQIFKLFTATLAGTEFDLAVQRAPGTNESTNTLPSELAGKLLGVKGVKQHEPGTIDYALLDLVKFEKEGVSDVLVNGWTPYRCPLFARFKFTSGHKLINSERNTIVIGEELAKRLVKKVGDTIELYGTEKFQIVGIYQSPTESENLGLVVPLEEMQRAKGMRRFATTFVTGFAITAERPIDDAGLEQLRERLEAIQPGLKVVAVPRTGGPATSPDPAKSDGK